VSPEPVYTRPLIVKLGVTPGARVALIDISDAEFLAALRARTYDISEGEPRPGTDIIFLAADSHEELSAIVELRGSLKPAGAIWVVSRKGRAATLRDVEIMAAAKAAGLVDNKVVAFSATHTSIRLVIPVALR
jgi:hypothetical protein